MKKWFLISSALVVFWSQGAIAGKPGKNFLRDGLGYEEGSDEGSPDLHTAYRCYEIADYVGNKDAKEAMRRVAGKFFAHGQVYEEGSEGTPQNLHTAYSYFEIAHKKGHPHAAAAMERVVEQMTPTQRNNYDPGRSVPTLPPEIWLPIITQSGSLGVCASVCPNFRAILEDDLTWRLLAKHYSVYQKENIPLKELVRVDSLMKKALFARFVKDSKAENNFLTQATQVGDGSAFWFSIPSRTYWTCLTQISGCKDVIEKQIDRGSIEALVRKSKGLSFGYNGYKADLEGLINFLEELRKQGRLNGFQAKFSEIEKDVQREKENRILKKTSIKNPSKLFSEWRHQEILNSLQKRTRPLSELFFEVITLFDVMTFY